MQLATNDRIYALDWLRVIAFSLLILYHVGMMYVGWGWHIQSSHSSESLSYLMTLVNQWRMPLLFFISGTACHFAIEKYQLLAFAKLRLLRLALPIIVGILLIAPPQLYFEMLYSHAESLETIHLGAFYLEYYNPQSQIFNGYETPLFHHMRWYHLWFVLYLLFYSLVLIILKKLLHHSLVSIVSKRLFSASNPIRTLIVPALLLYVVNLLLKDSFPRSWAFYNDWFAHGFFFCFFLFGYLIAPHRSAWSIIKHYRKSWLFIAIICYSFLMLITSLPEDTPLSDRVEEIIDLAVLLIMQINSWAWILAVTGYAIQYLNIKHHLIVYLNKAILPLFIFHQAITISFGYFAIQWYLGPILEPLLIISATIVGSFVGYELVKRSKITRILFGLPYHSKP